MRIFFDIIKKCVDCKFLCDNCPISSDVNYCKLTGIEVVDPNGDIPEWCELEDPMDTLEKNRSLDIMGVVNRLKDVANSMFADCDFVYIKHDGINFILQRDNDGKIRIY